VNPLISVILSWTSERDTWSFGQPILMAAHESTTAKFSPITDGVHNPQKKPWLSFSLQPSQVHVPRPPTRCHLQCCSFQTACPHPPFEIATWNPRSSPTCDLCEADDDVQDEQHVIFHCTHPIQCVFAGDMSPYSQRQEHRMFLLFCTRTTTNSIVQFPP
jgi:hypothetical protein